MNKESALIQKAIRGDEDSFKRLIDNYKNYIFAIILNFIKDHEEAENVAQEVFLQIYLSLSNYEDENFKGWISRIASNKSIDILRSKRSKFREETLETTEELIDKLQVPEKNNPENILIEKEEREDLLYYLNSIPDIYKSTLKMFYFEDKTYEEIAKVEEVTVKTVASRLHRGKIILREKWRGSL